MEARAQKVSDWNLNRIWNWNGLEWELERPYHRTHWFLINIRTGMKFQYKRKVVIGFWEIGVFPFPPKIGMGMRPLPTKRLEWESFISISIPIPQSTSPQPNMPLDLL